MNDRCWRGLWVDRGLKDSWLVRMNRIKGVQVDASCAGHRNRPAYLMYRAPKGDRDIVLALAHLGHLVRVEPIGGGYLSVKLIKPAAGGGFKFMSKSRWWDRILSWLEKWYGRLPPFKVEIR